MKQLYEQKIPALITDGLMCKRDPRFAEQGKYQDKPHPLHNKRPAKPLGKFRPHDFIYDADTDTCICPAGHFLYSNGSHCVVDGRTHRKF